MMDDLAAVLAELEQSTSVTTVVLSGAGKSFSAGVDVAAHTPDKVESMLSKFHGVIRALVSSRKITVAAVHGHCLGGGAELAMACDVVYSASDAVWGFPEIKLGCYPPVACAALAALVGQKRAAELILSGRTITGSEAAAIGLATRAVPSSELAGTVDRLLDDLGQQSSAALALAKRAIYAWDATHFEKGLARSEKIYTDELMRTEDAREGISAFVEKRNPKWTGK